MNLVKITALLLLLLTVTAGASFAQAKNNGHRERAALPIKITSNELAADNKGKVAVFTGKVVAKQGDITIYSDRLTISYAEKKDVEKIEADGNVRIIQENKIATALHAMYDRQQGKIILTGNPKVTEGVANTISGSIITYYIDEERSEVKSEAGTRVQTTIQPPTRKK